MNDALIRVFAEAALRRQEIVAAHKATDKAVEQLKPLIGQRLLKLHVLYEVTEIHNDWEGGFGARGYRILKNDRRGSQIWDIGFICPAYFEAYEKERKL